MPVDTLLVITPIGLAPYSARGLKQTLEPIDASKNLRYTVNGALKNIAPARFKKYKSTITCSDVQTPGLDGVFPGDAVTIDSVQELSYATAGGAPARPVVPGSSRVDGDRTFYRPRLSMIVIDFQLERDEWGAETGWHLDLSEA